MRDDWMVRGQALVACRTVPLLSGPPPRPSPWKGEGARSPVVDAHLHCRPGSVRILLRALDLAEIDGGVLLGHPSLGAELLDEVARDAPRRLRVLVTPDLSLAGTGAAWDAELRTIERLLDQAAGIKLYKDANFGVRNRQGARVSLLSAELEPLWAIAAARGVPVLVHAADPLDFWRRSPRLRGRALEVHPEARCRGRSVPSRRRLLRDRDELLRRWPDVRFVGAHFGGFPATRAELARFLALGPCDTSAALEEVLTFDRPAVDALLRTHRHDVMWGSDLILGEQPPGHERTAIVLSAKFLADALRLATAAEAVHSPSPVECPWRAPGLALPGPLRDEVLGGNAVRVYWRGRWP
ncbi:MAG TPA: amidohydrolase family protein [Candidatus Dormibacteraeota bacterium]|nr:amidohydrolase family protein [Candidatus Dormibacteraeota bacterium]